MRTIRDWLQIEIWSSRTTSKVGKIIAFCIAVICMAGFIWRWWLNPVEKRASRAMLQEARIIRTVPEENFFKESTKAKELEAKAEKAAWTYRDHSLEMAGSATLFLAQSCRELEFKIPKRFDSGPCNKDYESLDSIVRDRVDVDHGFLGF